MRIVSQTAAAGTQVVVPIELVCAGDENAVSFSLSWDSSRLLTYVGNTLGSAIPTDGSASMIRNSTQAATGKFGILMGLAPGTAFTAGTKTILNLTFEVSATAPADAALAVAFTDTPHCAAHHQRDPDRPERSLPEWHGHCDGRILKVT